MQNTVLLHLVSKHYLKFSNAMAVITYSHNNNMLHFNKKYEKVGERKTWKEDFLKQKASLLFILM